MMGFGFGFMGLFWILAILAVIVLVVVLARAGGRREPGGASPPPRASGETPEEILRKRYARGEIDHDEYEKRLADLRR